MFIKSFWLNILEGEVIWYWLYYSLEYNVLQRNKAFLEPISILTSARIDGVFSSRTTEVKFPQISYLVL